MAFDRVNISTLVPSQVPEYIRTNYQTFVQFIQAYYDYMDQTGVVVDISTIRDLDKSVDVFINHIKSEIAPKIPFDIASHRFDAMHLRDLYDAKGSESSIKLLFRMLYGKEAEVTYPSQQMLIPSDGRWKQPNAIFVRFDGDTTNIRDLIGQLITINNNGLKIQVFVERVEPVVILNGTQQQVVDPSIFQLYISKDYFGTIVTGASVTAIVDTETFVGEILPSTTKINIISGGQGFKVGEIYGINTKSGTGALLKINKVDANGAILQGVLIGAGVNYSTTFTTTLFANKYSQSADLPGFSVSYAGGTYSTSLAEKTNPMADGGIITYYDYTQPLDHWDNSFVGNPTGSFYNLGTTVTVDLSLAANIEVIVDAVVKYPGYFASNAGFLSDALYIQDSKYYQQFSYVVKLDQTLDSYAGVLKSLLHPAGVNLFGEFNLNDSIMFDIGVEDIIGGNGQTSSENFIVNGVLDNRMSFVRAQAANYFGANGLFQSAGSNVPRVDYKPTTLNLIKSSEWKNGVSDGTLSGVTTGAVSWPGLPFTNGATFGSPGGTTVAYQFPIGYTVSGQTYTISAYVKMTDGLAPNIMDPTPQSVLNDFALVLDGGVPIPSALTVTSIGNGVYRVTGTKTANTTTSSFGIVKYNTNSTRTFVATGFQLEFGNIVGPYVPTNGSAAGTGTLNGLLIEETRSNYLWNSLNIAANFTPSGATVTANAIIAPDGSMTGTLVTPTALGTLIQGYVNTAGTTVFNYSIYIKQGNTTAGSTMLLIRNTSTAVNLVTVTVNLADMSIVVGGQGASPTGSITYVSNGWYRVSMTCATAVTAGQSMAAYGGNSWTNGVSYYLWGAQLEIGSWATSLITTAGATGNRNADIATLTSLTLPWYNNTEGTLYVDGSVYNTSITYSTAASIDANTTLDRLELGFNASNRPYCFANGPGVMSSPALIPGNTFKIAAAYDTNVYLASNANSVTLVGPNVRTSGYAPSYLRVGRSSAGQSFSGYIKTLTYYPRKLADADLQALTT